MTVAIALDLFVAALLVATIVYAILLNRKLARLRADRSAFEKLLKDFSLATERAENGVALLQRTAATSAAELDSKRDGAVALRDDLEFLVARAEEQADRLDGLISRGRDKEMPRAPVSSMFDRLRESEAAKPSAPVEDDPVFAPDDGDDRPDGVTPAWLEAARRVAGADTVLR